MKRRLRSISAAEWFHLVQAVVFILVVRLGLRIFPFQRLIGWLRRGAKTFRSRQAADEAYKRRVTWAASAAARRLLPNRPCLTQALVVQFLLMRRHCPAQLQIGVTKEDGALAAHAWVELDGRVLIGGPTSPSRYRRLDGIDDKIVAMQEREAS
ncbi:MAG: lasso peptide biosynthesis B2 protein [Bacteroidetes bacterium]|jgi:hypothetical protein|nr:lasso peptide biosynthesis B2 protein [Bacteroidota bacterium]